MEREPHEHVLARAGLVEEGRFEFVAVEQWTVESLVGFVFSTSILGRAVIGDRADEFARDVQARLVEAMPDAVFEQDVTFAYQLARRRA